MPASDALRLVLADAPPELLSARDLMVRFGLKKSRFYSLEKRGAFKFLETKRPFGPRRYARVLVDKYLAGDSPTQFRRMA